MMIMRAVMIVTVVVSAMMQSVVSTGAQRARVNGEDGATNWTVYDNMETIDSCVACDGCNSTENGVFFLGHPATWQDCQALCAGNSACVSFDFHVAPSGRFSHSCYSRNTDNFQPKKSRNRVVGMKPGYVPGTAPACVTPPAPGPTPPPPAPGGPIDCAFRRLGMIVASRNLMGNVDKLAQVAKGLVLDECTSTLGADARSDSKSYIGAHANANPPPTSPSSTATDTMTIYVSTKTGKDSNSGTESAPYATLARAKVAVQSVAGKQGVDVMVASGTYFENLVFTPKDSGTAQAPVRWIGAGTTADPVLISGGKKIVCVWTNTTINNITAHVCKLDSSVNPFQSLFVNGKRMKRARYPNGDPYVPMSGYASAGSGACKGPPSSPIAPNYNVAIVNNHTGKVLSQGYVHPLTSTMKNVTVRGDNEVHDMGAFANFRAFVGGSNECFNTTLNLPFWQTCTCACNEMTFGALASRAPVWKTPSTGVIHMFHSNGWGNWMFDVDSVDTAAGIISMTGGQQTGQSGSCGIRGNQMYIENLIEELDDEGEFFFDEKTSELYFVSPENLSMATAEVIATQHARVVQFRGSDDNTFAQHITMMGFSFSHSEPTFVGSYELPSGGDWTIHRGGMVFLDGAEHITITNCTFDQAGGNSLFLSQHAWYTTVYANTFSYSGDSAIVVAGSTDLMNGTRNTYVAYTNISNNLVFEVGYYGKQTAAFFQSISYRTSLINNVMFNGPRSGVNYNDVFKGGHLMQGNLAFGYVRETQDHASFNSWDRQSWFFQNDDGSIGFEPENNRITRNLILNKDFVYGSLESDWCIDHDDASSYYYDDFNVLVWGAHKWRDGINKSYVSNLYVTPPDAGLAQQWGVGWYNGNTARSRFLNNTFVNWGSKMQFGFVWSAPSPAVDFDVDFNTYLTPNQTSLPFHIGSASTLDAWKKMCNCDAHATLSADVDLAQTLTMAHSYLQLDSI